MLLSKCWRARLWRSGTDGYNTGASMCFDHGSESGLFILGECMSVHFGLGEMDGACFSDLFR